MNVFSIQSPRYELYHNYIEFLNGFLILIDNGIIWNVQDEYTVYLTNNFDCIFNQNSLENKLVFVFLYDYILYIILFYFFIDI